MRPSSGKTRAREEKRDGGRETWGKYPTNTAHQSLHPWGEKEKEMCSLLPFLFPLCGLIISVKRLVEVLREM